MEGISERCIGEDDSGYWMRERKLNVMLLEGSQNGDNACMYVYVCIKV